MKLHETIKNFYLKVLKPMLEIEVLGLDGTWNKINSVNITKKQLFYEISTKNKSLLCTKNHILIDENNEEVLAINSKGKIIKTIDGNEKIIDVKKTNIFDHAYDLSLDNKSKHLYFANDMLSHNCIICDEFAFLQRSLADKLFTSMYPTISSSKEGKFIIVSTPNGTDNLYYDIWMQANAKDQSKNLDGWKPFTMFWWQVPEHDELWKLKLIAAIGEKRFAQEFNNEFLADSGTRTLINGDILTKYRIKLSEYKAAGFLPKKQKIVSLDEKELFEFLMWHEFEPSHTYAASMDISEGVGSDASVLYIWDVTNLSNIVMCAKFSSNTVSLVQFAYIARKILSLYGDPPLAAERNGVSAGTLDSLRITYGYLNIVVENKKREAGIYSHVTVKEKACIWCKEMMETAGFGFTIYDKELIDEIGIFCKKDTKGTHQVYQALPGPDSHDDHVMAFIWLTYILDNERVDTYFRLCLTFTSEFGKIYARILQPYNLYTGEQWKSISNDPLYKEFLEYKEESMNKCKLLTEAEKADDSRDLYLYKSLSSMYFDDDDGPMWGSSRLTSRSSPSLHPGSAGPSFFVM